MKKKKIKKIMFEYNVTQISIQRISSCMFWLSYHLSIPSMKSYGEGFVTITWGNIVKESILPQATIFFLVFGCLNLIY